MHICSNATSCQGGMHNVLLEQVSSKAEAGQNVLPCALKLDLVLADDSMGGRAAWSLRANLQCIIYQQAVLSLEGPASLVMGAELGWPVAGLSARVCVALVNTEQPFSTKLTSIPHEQCEHHFHCRACL